MAQKTLSTLILSFALITVLIFQTSCKSESMLVTSPDGKIELTLNVSDDGQVFGTIKYNGQVVMANNKIGLIREDEDFSKRLTLINTSEIISIEDNYSLLHGKKTSISYKANQKEYHLQNANQQKMDIIFRISNDGVAFQYLFPETSDDAKKLKDEVTSFEFNEGTTAWIQPMSVAKSGWEQVNPCYEEYYEQEVNVKNLRTYEPGWIFPALFKSGDIWMAISETAPNMNYCGCKLVHDTLTNSFKIGFPQEKETIFNGPLNPESALPWSTPWRIIVIGDKLATIAESTLGTDLAKPSVIEDMSFIKPGRSSWSWVILKDDSTVFDVQKRFIDYSAEMGWEYCLVDADWDRKIGYEKMQELCTYAKSKNVGINVWYNSAGDWNTTPYTPKDRLLTKELRDEEFKKLKEIGVSGVKIDFFGGDGQSVMQYYQEILEDAAKYQILVNCHGSTLPRGWQRTYPNLMTMEGIRGFEYVTFAQDNTDREANHSTVLPFTRNLFDPMDFTPVCFSEVPRLQRKTTNCFELALSVIFLSGIQHFAEIPRGMATVPKEVKEFMKDVTVSWDETKFIEGYPGKYVVIARKKGDEWFIGGINGQESEQEVTLDLSFMNSPSVQLFTDNGRREFNIQNLDENSQKELTIKMNPKGGFAIRSKANN
ncbi:MAG: glycoside hydrolase family 97 catalytic domain-containing protein [Bacteroidales bacterium]|nr:glycoside hydrolase family 97 catalytic domain-containing protein [Bacteroidales bacterium]